MNKVLKSFGYAFKGMVYTARTQLNFRIHLAATILAVFLGWNFSIKVDQWLWILLSITLVLAAELFNTAIEALTDLVSPQIHPKAAIAKDTAAAAVTLTAIFALLVGLIIFVPLIVALF